MKLLRSCQLGIACLLFSISATGKEIHWNELSFDLDAVAAMPAPTYAVIGTKVKEKNEIELKLKMVLTLATEAKDDKLLLTDTMNIKGTVGKTTLLSQKNNSLTPEKISYQKIVKDEVVKETVVEISDDGDYSVDLGKGVEEKQYPTEAITITGLMRLVGQLPKEDGLVVTIPILPNSLKRPFQSVDKLEEVTLAYQGTKEITHNDATMTAHVYQLNVKRPIQYYVDSQNRLIRIKQKGTPAMTLTSEEQLKKLSKDG